MKINTKLLKNNLKVLNKSASSNADIIISINNDILKVITPEVSFTQYIKDNTSNTIAVELKLSDFKKAVNIIKTIDTDINITNGYLIIGECKIKVMVSDYREESITGEKIILPADYLVPSLAKCIFYSDEAFKPIYKGILFDFQKDKLILASTDGKVLNKNTLIIESNIEKKIILSTEAIKSLLELKKQNKKLEGDILIYINNIYISFMYADIERGVFTFTSNILDGKYPDIERVMPDFESKETKTVIFSKDEAIKSIKALSHLCKENRYKNLYLKMSDNQITFYGIGEKSNSSMKSTIKASYDCKENTIIGFSYKHLLDLLSVVNTDIVELKCTLLEDTENNSPSYIKETNSIYLIMRVNLDVEEIKNKLNSVDSIDGMDILNTTTESVKHEEPTTLNKSVSDKAMRLYASDKEDKKYSEKQGTKYLKGYCFENRNGKLCQVGKFFYRAGYFVEAIKRIGFDINRVQIIDSKSLAS